MTTNTDFVIKFDKSIIDETQIEADGKKIYRTNSFFRSMSNLMEHPEFQPVFKEHFKSWDDIKVFVMFLKVYERVGDQFPDFNGYHKISLVKTLIETAPTRKLICDEVIKTYNKSHQHLINPTNQKTITNETDNK